MIEYTDEQVDICLDADIEHEEFGTQLVNWTSLLDQFVESLSLDQIDQIDQIRDEKILKEI